jgi:hypothetical protein
MKVENPPFRTVPPFLNIFQIALLRNFSIIDYYKTGQKMSFSNQNLGFFCCAIIQIINLKFSKISSTFCRTKKYLNVMNERFEKTFKIAAQLKMANFDFSLSKIA